MANMKYASFFLCAVVMLAMAIASPVAVGTSRRYTPRAEICQFVGPAAGCEAKCPEGFKEKARRGGADEGTCRTGQTIACCLDTEGEGGEGAEGKEVRE
ncbi:sialidase [Colletotrichum plurivorum]|uniref:Sialidase n=1 Tax=Colletotrichum plurivorum TaxID=2175906 RepID=A0A8H6NK37_9PEZI|nr:sialidase [Colletotrichum plurivorum]